MVSGDVECFEFGNYVTGAKPAYQIAAEAPIRSLLRHLAAMTQQRAPQAGIWFLQPLRPLVPPPRRGLVSRRLYCEEVFERCRREIQELNPSTPVEVFFLFLSK